MLLFINDGFSRWLIQLHVDSQTQAQPIPMHMLPGSFPFLVLFCFFSASSSLPTTYNSSMSDDFAILSVSMVTSCIPFLLHNQRNFYYLWFPLLTWIKGQMIILKGYRQNKNPYCTVRTFTVRQTHLIHMILICWLLWTPMYLCKYTHITLLHKWFNRI